MRPVPNGGALQQAAVNAGRARDALLRGQHHSSHYNLSAMKQAGQSPMTGHGCDPDGDFRGAGEGAAVGIDRGVARTGMDTVYRLGAGQANISKVYGQQDLPTGKSAHGDQLAGNRKCDNDTENSSSSSSITALARTRGDPVAGQSRGRENPVTTGNYIKVGSFDGLIETRHNDSHRSA